MSKRTIMSFRRANSGNVTTEVSEIETVECEEAPERSKFFTNTDDPLWITIRFLTEPTEDDLFNLYDICQNYNLFEVGDVLEEIKKDIEKGFCSEWVIKFAGPFREAWGACYNIQSDALDIESGMEKYEVSISETPPDWWRDKHQA